MVHPVRRLPVEHGIGPQSMPLVREEKVGYPGARSQDDAASVGDSHRVGGDMREVHESLDRVLIGLSWVGVGAVQVVGAVVTLAVFIAAVLVVFVIPAVLVWRAVAG